MRGSERLPNKISGRRPLFLIEQRLFSFRF
jgi:hypothetical protein